MRLIDVIVPVYGVEDFLEKCVDSLLAQDIDAEYGVILVDDGSPDGCPAMCDAYAEKHPGKVTVIHKENGGQSDARNVGVAASEAEYIVFVDADDHVADNHLSSLYDALVRENADMAASPARREFPLPNGGVRYEPPATAPASRLSRDEMLCELCFESFLPGYPVCKLIPRSIAAAHPFPVGRIFEDTGTVYKYVLDCETVAYTPEVTYDYLQRPGSTLRRRFGERHLDNVLFSAEMREEFRKARLPRHVQDAAAFKVSRACYIAAYHAASTLPFGEYLNVHKALSPYYDDTLPTALKQPAANTWRRLMFRISRHPRLMYALVRLKER